MYQDEIKRLEQIVKQLQADDGCPWDKVQTHESIKAGCIEEACEVLAGINILRETGNAENLKEELGVTVPVDQKESSAGTGQQ